jgi:hypothetical protein
MGKEELNMTKKNNLYIEDLPENIITKLDSLKSKSILNKKQIVIEAIQKYKLNKKHLK